MKLPPYVKLRKQTYWYDRAYPIHLRSLAPTQRFARSLGLKQGAALLAIQRAAVEAGDTYESICRGLLNNTDEYAKYNMVTAILDRANLANEKAATSFEQYGRDELIELLLEVHGYSDAVERQSKRQKGIDIPVTTKDEALLEAAQLLRSGKRQAPLLSKLWADYVKHRGLDVTGRVGSKSQKRWDRFFSITGELHCTHETNEDIALALQQYADQREGHVSSGTIERELSDIMQALKIGSKRYSLRWVIQRPVIATTAKNIRRPLTVDEQHKLMAYLDNNPTDHSLNVVLLLALQGAMIPSEIARLCPNDIGLNTRLPHLIIRNETKTDARKRVVPIVLRHEYLAEHIDEAIKWLNNTTESNWSARLKQLLRSAVNDDKATLYWLRHTFKSNAQIAGASALTINSIAGWTDEQRNENEHLFHYGSEGIVNSEVVQRLFSDSKLINAHLLG